MNCQETDGDSYQAVYQLLVPSVRPTHELSDDHLRQLPTNDSHRARVARVCARRRGSPENSNSETVTQRNADCDRLMTNVLEGFVLRSAVSLL